MAIKLVAADMDGTTLTDAKELTEQNIRAMKAVRDAGIKMVFCTGRPITGVEPYIEQLGFDGEDEFMIVQNGAAMYRLSDYQQLDGHTLSPEDASAVLSFYDQLGAQTIIGLTEREFLYAGGELNERMNFEAETLRMTPQKITLQDIATYDDLYKLFMIADEAAIDTIESKLPKDLTELVNVIRTMPELIEFIPLSINKAYALKKLSKQLDIAPEDIFAIGDEHNDVEMLEYAGTSVAMGNANPVAKRVADHITDTNENSGMGKALEKYVLNQL